MAKLGPKEAQRRELRRRVAAEAIAHQRFVASTIPALEAMVAQWRKAHPANDKPTLVTAKPKPRKEVVPNTALARRPEPRNSDDTATPPATSTAPGAMPPEPPNSPTGGQVSAADIGGLAAKIVSGEPRQRLEAMSRPEVEALAGMLGTTAAELVASLNYYRAHKRAVAARKKRLRNSA